MYLNRYLRQGCRKAEANEQARRQQPPATANARLTPGNGLTRKTCLVTRYSRLEGAAVSEQTTLDLPGLQMTTEDLYVKAGQLLSPLRQLQLPDSSSR
jgi:hypothetical protein